MTLLPPSKLLAYGSAVLAGFVILSLELLGFRLLAPSFGYSTYVFGALIGVVLLALSVGYLLGGYAGDRSWSGRTIAYLLLASAAYLLIIRLSHPLILDAFFQLHVVVGALLATLALLAVPMVLLASLSPYIIKAMANSGQRVGASAGRIYAVSTLGSLAGTFATSFWLVPTYGANLTLTINVALVTLLALMWLLPALKGAARPAAALLLVPVLLANPTTDLPSNVRASVDSPYAHLEVKDFGTFLGLQTDRRNDLIYSYYPKRGEWDYAVPLDNYFAVLPLLNGARTSLLLGLGAGSLPLLHEAANPDLSITGIEIDPTVIELGRQFFALDERTNTHTVIADVRPYLAQHPEDYDYIEVDLFWGGGEIPFYLATEEFFTLTRERLTERGILAMNVFDPSPDRKILQPVLNTVASVYEHVYYVPAPDGSYFVAASLTPIVAADVRRVAADTTDGQLRNVLNDFADGLTPVEHNPTELTLTDDLAPLEQLTFEAIFSQR